MSDRTSRPGQDFYIALIQSTLRAFRKHKEPMSYTDRSAHANKAKSYRYFRQYRNPGQDASGKMTHMVTLLQQHLPYYRRRYTVYRTPKT